MAANEPAAITVKLSLHLLLQAHVASDRRVNSRSLFAPGWRKQ
jgi:hypothetical protein